MELISILKDLKTFIVRILSFENIGNKTTSIQNSGSGDVVMGDKNVNTTNIHISPYPSVFLSVPAQDLLQKIVENGKIGTEIFLLRTDQAVIAKIDDKFDIKHENIEEYLDELCEWKMIECKTNKRYILLARGIDYIKGKS